tara:strand:- start:514 stop:786 length:273 start_codon:yes stop_codon:yes gene_type:complete
MAIKIKKQKKIYVTGSSGDITGSIHYVTASLETKMSQSFAAAEHLKDRHWITNKGNRAFVYQLKLMEQDIDEIRRYTVDDKEQDIDGGSF